MITEKDEIFAESVARGLSPQAAANAAGLQNAPQKTEVKALIQTKKQALSLNCGITKETVLNGFMDAIGQSETAMEQIAGYREVGKMLGFYEPERIEVNITTGAVGHLSNEKLLELADMEDIIDSEYHILDA